jgi:CBS domain-containing protein
MTPPALGDDVVRECPQLRETDTVGEAVRAILDSGLPALPVADRKGHLSGIFGEREFMAALFPGYVGELASAGFVPKTLDSAIERRARCRDEAVRGHMLAEPLQVGPDFSDLEVVEMFLHHRVLIVPVVDRGRLVGVITRRDFFRGLAERLLNAR